MGLAESVIPISAFSAHYENDSFPVDLFKESHLLARRDRWAGERTRTRGTHGGRSGHFHLGWVTRRLRLMPHHIRATHDNQQDLLLLIPAVLRSGHSYLFPSDLDNGALMGLRSQEAFILSRRPL